MAAAGFGTRLFPASKAIKKELFPVIDRHGKVKPVIDRCFPLQETAEAFRHYHAGHMQGKVVIAVLDAHERIYGAICEKDPEKASAEMYRHVHEVEEHLAKLKESIDLWQVCLKLA